MFEKIRQFTEWLKNKIVCFAKIWETPRQHLGFFEDWRDFGNPQKNLQVQGRNYFALLFDRFITYANKIGSSATRGLVDLS